MNIDSSNIQDIFLHNRKDLSISNVKKIIELNDNLVEIETGFGKVRIEGKDLEMVSLNNEKETLILKGTIDKVEFLEKTKDKKEKSFLAKMFQ